MPLTTRERRAKGKEHARINCALFLALVKGTEHSKKKKNRKKYSTIDFYRCLIQISWKKGFHFKPRDG